MPWGGHVGPLSQAAAAALQRQRWQRLIQALLGPPDYAGQLSHIIADAEEVRRHSLLTARQRLVQALLYGAASKERRRAARLEALTLHIALVSGDDATLGCLLRSDPTRYAEHIARYLASRSRRARQKARTELKHRFLAAEVMAVMRLQPALSKKAAVGIVARRRNVSDRTVNLACSRHGVRRPVKKKR